MHFEHKKITKRAILIGLLLIPLSSLDIEFRNGYRCHRNHLDIALDRRGFFLIPPCFGECLSGEGCASPCSYPPRDADDLRNAYDRDEHQWDWYVRVLDNSTV